MGILVGSLNGDLSGEPLQTNTKDETGQLILAMNEMTNHTRKLLMEIQTASGTVTSYSEDLTQATGDVKSGSEQISVTMQELATGAETQGRNTSKQYKRSFYYYWSVYGENS